MDNTGLSRYRCSGHFSFHSIISTRFLSVLRVLSQCEDPPQYSCLATPHFSWWENSRGRRRYATVTRGETAYLEGNVVVQSTSGSMLSKTNRAGPCRNHSMPNPSPNPSPNPNHGDVYFRCRPPSSRSFRAIHHVEGVLYAVVDPANSIKQLGVLQLWVQSGTRAPVTFKERPFAGVAGAS